MTAAIFITLRRYSVTAANATLDASGTFATLNAVASDSLGGADLVYTWSVTGGNASEVDFEDNYDNTARLSSPKSANATFADFYAPGNYTLTLTVEDGVDAPVTTSANVTVTAIVSDIEVASTDPTPGADGTQQFTATAYDQFGDPFITPPTFTWSVSGGYSISSTGLLTAPATPGAYTVTVANGTISGTSSDAAFIPAAPSDLTVTDVNSNEIDLSWTNNASNGDGFIISRDDGSGDGFMELAEIDDSSATSYQDVSAVPGTRYTYQVQAMNVTGSSSSVSPDSGAPGSAGFAVDPADDVTTSASFANSSLTAGGNATLTLTATQDATPLKWLVNWGDGITQAVTAGNATGANSTSCVTVTHDYVTKGNYTANATFSDGYQTYTPANASVTVAAATPTVSIAPTSTDEPAITNSAYTLILSASVPGGATISNWTINWGDGDPQSISGDPYSVAHVYTVGDTDYTISASVTTSDGANATANSISIHTTPTDDPALDAPADLTATPNEDGSITLDWTYEGTGQQGFKVEESADGSNYAQIAVITDPDATSYTVSSPDGDDPHYRVRAFDGPIYNSGFSNVADVSHPLISNLTATPATSTSITLNWQSPDDAETDWIIQQLTDSGYVDIDTVSGTTRDYTVTGLSNSFADVYDQNLISYTFRVIGADDSPESVSDPVTAYTAGDGSDTPENNPSMQVDTENTTWYYDQGVPGNATGIDIQFKQDGDWSDVFAFSFGSVSDPDAPQTFVYASLQNFVHPGTFQMRARYYNTGGFGDWGDATTYTVTLSPPAPDSVTATANANGTVTLEVNPGTPADDYSGYANNEDILISGSNDDGATFSYSDSTDQNWDVEEVDGVEMPVAIPTTVTLGGLTAGTHYIFEVSVGAPGINSDDTGLSAPTTADATTYDANATVPNAPSDLVIVPQSGNGTNTTLEWTDHSENESGFIIQKSSDGSTWANLTLTAADTRAYTDTDADDAGDFFQVAAVNSAGTSNYTLPVSDNLPAAPTNLTTRAAPDLSGIELAWQDNSTNESGFEIDRSTSSDFSANLTTFDVGENTTYYEDTDSIVSGTTYYYRVSASASNDYGLTPQYATANGTLTLPTVSICTDLDNGTIETGDVMQFKITLTAALPENDEITLASYTGTAAQDHDYTAPTTVQISAGQTVAYVQVTPQFNQINEDSDLTIISLLNSDSIHKATISSLSAIAHELTPQLHIIETHVLADKSQGDLTASGKEPNINAGDEVDLTFHPQNFLVRPSTIQWNIQGSNDGGAVASLDNTGKLTLLTADDLKKGPVTFHWIGGDYSIGVLETAQISVNSMSTSVGFIVSKPNYAPIATEKFDLEFTRVGSVYKLGYIRRNPYIPNMQFDITPQPTKQSGTFQWVQTLVSSYHITYKNGYKEGYTNISGLDTFYPYPMDLPNDYPGEKKFSTSDNPRIDSLSPTAKTITFSDDFNMYLEWNSGLNGAIYVPLGHIKWGFSFNNLDMSHLLTLPLPADLGKGYDSLVSDDAYPTWTIIIDPRTHRYIHRE